MHFLGHIAGGIAADEHIAGALLQHIELCGVCLSLRYDGGPRAHHLQRHAAEDGLPWWQREHVEEQVALDSTLCIAMQRASSYAVQML